MSKDSQAVAVVFNEPAYQDTKDIYITDIQCLLYFGDKQREHLQICTSTEVFYTGKGLLSKLVLLWFYKRATRNIITKKRISFTVIKML